MCDMSIHSKIYIKLKCTFNIIVASIEQQSVQQKSKYKSSKNIIIQKSFQNNKKKQENNPASQKNTNVTCIQLSIEWKLLNDTDSQVIPNDGKYKKLFQYFSSFKEKNEKCVCFMDLKLLVFARELMNRCRHQIVDTYTHLLRYKRK